MSKSLGNFFTLRNLEAKSFTGREIRYALLQAHYRDTYNFTLDGLAGARTALARIDECLGKLRELSKPLSQSSTSLSRPAATARQRDESDGERGASGLVVRFASAMDENLNIAAGWACVFDWVRETNKRISDNSLSAQLATTELTEWKLVNSVLGISEAAEAETPSELIELMNEREAARKARDFKRSDVIRDELKAKGWIIEDTPKGPKLKRV